MERARESCAHARANAGSSATALLVVADRPAEARRHPGRAMLREACSPLRNRRRPRGSVVGFSASAALFGRRARRPSACGHARGDVGLHLEDVGQRRVEGLLPPGGCRRSPPRPARDSPAPGSVRRAFSHRTVPVSRYSHAELRARSPAASWRSCCTAGAAAGDDLQARQERQLAPDLVGDAVGEVVVLGRAQVLEREHGEPRHQRSGRRTRLRGAPRPHEERGAHDGGQRNGAPGQRGSA